MSSRTPLSMRPRVQPFRDCAQALAHAEQSGNLRRTQSPLTSGFMPPALMLLTNTTAFSVSPPTSTQTWSLFLAHRRFHS